MKRIIFHLLLVTFLIFPGQAAQARDLSLGRESGRQVDTDAYALIDEVNALRVSNGLPAYSINPILMLIAQQHAEYMAVNGVSHAGAGGTRPYQRALDAGYPVGGDLTLGGFFSENIIAGFDKSVQQAVSDWKNSAPHLNTMLSTALTEIGAGVAIVESYVYYVIDCSTPSESFVFLKATETAVYTGPTRTPRPTITGTATPVTTIFPNTPGTDGMLYHIVQPGETLWLIAISYDITVAEIRQLNRLTEDQNIYPGNKLLIKTFPTQTPTPTVTLTVVPSYTPVPTWTSEPTIVPSPTVLKVAPVKADSTVPVLGAIMLAALILAGVLTVAMRVRK